jgi:hypothetical protein
MNNKMPNLKILPVDQLLRHEWHDDQRAKPLVDRLRGSGVLRNPPIVTPLGDDSGRYMVLDGANRTTALGQMAIPHTICQVVDANDPGLQLKTWNHVLWEMKPELLLEKLEELDGITLKSINPKKKLESIWPQKTLVWVQIADGKAHIARSNPKDLTNQARKLAAIADSYSSDARLDRTRANQISELDGIYSDLCALVVYPPFEVAEVQQLCSEGVLLPPGVTRFTISPRALRVNYPLEDLAADKSLSAKNQSLERWQNERMARKGVRYYDEATVLYDE